MKLKIYTLTVGALALGFMASCSNEMKDGDVAHPSDLKMQIAQNPDFVAWSGNSSFINTLGNTRAEESQTHHGTTKYDNDEVEINLSINDIHTLFDGETPKYDIDDLVSKLSVHVRCATEVEVVLPVPEEIYCDQDDLYLFNVHGQEYEWEGTEKERTFSIIEGNPITIKVAYAPKGVRPTPPPVPVYKPSVTVESNKGPLEDYYDFNDGYIQITILGITEDVIDFCRQNYGDGVNIELYNYYNRGNINTIGSFNKFTFDELKSVLDNSVVNFGYAEDNLPAPDYYINAFAEVSTENEDGEVTVEGYNQDCKVEPYNYNSEVFYNPYIGEHFNGSSFNLIYVNRRIQGIDESENN